MAVGDEGRLEAGRDAVRRRSWPEAYDHLAASDAVGELEPPDLERLGKAAWWVGRPNEAIDARERAYAEYVRRGDVDRAAFVALTLRREHTAKLAASVSTGWLRRAEKLLVGRAPSVAAGYLAIAHAEIAWNAGDHAAALADIDRALEVAEGSDDRDLLAWAVMRKGMVLVSTGRMDEGWSLMEEVSAAAVGGELGAYTTGAVFCNVVSMSRDMADYARAREWSDAAKRWCERQAITGFPGVCRVHRAEVMRLMGAWADAEEEVRRATVELRDFNPAYAGMAFHELGEVRLRMGDLEAADEALRQAHELGEDPQPGLALLFLARGKVAAAASSIARSLEELSTDRLARSRLLPAQAEIAWTAGDAATARAAAEELDTIASDYGTPAIQAAAEWAHGLADLAGGDAPAAVRRLRRARQVWQETEAPYESARARVALAEAHAAEGERETAAIELGSALTSFERLGAVRDAAVVAERLARLGTAAAPTVSRTFAFTDIVGSTNLLQAIGDEAWTDLRRWHDEIIRRCVAEHGGEEIDHTGDGFFVAFPDSRAAAECAIEIQRTLSEHRRAHGFAPQIRVGLHAADAPRVDGKYTGIGVHAAARIGALARAGEILASVSTVEAVDGLRLTPSRSETLKGVGELEVVSIDWL